MNTSAAAVSSSASSGNVMEGGIWGGIVRALTPRPMSTPPSPKSPSANAKRAVGTASPGPRARSSSLSRSYSVEAAEPYTHCVMLLELFSRMCENDELRHYRAHLRQVQQDKFYAKVNKNQLIPAFLRRLEKDEKTLRAKFETLKQKRDAYSPALRLYHETKEIAHLASMQRRACEYHDCRKEFEAFYLKWSKKCANRYGITLAETMAVPENWELDKPFSLPNNFLRTPIVESIYRKFAAELKAQFTGKNPDEIKQYLFEEQLLNQDDYAVARVLEKEQRDSYLHFINQHIYQIFEYQYLKASREQSKQDTGKNPEFQVLTTTYLFAQCNKALNQMLFISLKIRVMLQNALHKRQDDVTQAFANLQLEVAIPPPEDSDRKQGSVIARQNVPPLQLLQPLGEVPTNNILLTPKESLVLFQSRVQTEFYLSTPGKMDDTTVIPLEQAPLVQATPERHVDEAIYSSVIENALAYKQALDNCDRVVQQILEILNSRFPTEPQEVERTKHQLKTIHTYTQQQKCYITDKLSFLL